MIPLLVLMVIWILIGALALWRTRVAENVKIGDTQFKEQKYTAREWEPGKSVYDQGHPRPIKKWTDPAKEAADYRSNYERIFGHK